MGGCLRWPGSCDRDTGVFWWGSRTPSSPSASEQALIPAQNQRGRIIPPSKWEHGVQPCLSPTGILPATEGEFQSYIPSFIDASSRISYPSEVQSALNSFPRAKQGSPGSLPQKPRASSTRKAFQDPHGAAASGRCWPEPAFIPSCPYTEILARLQRHFYLSRQGGSSELLHFVRPHFTELLSSAVNHTGDRNKVTTVVTTYRHHRVSISPELSRQPLRWKIYTFPALMCYIPPALPRYPKVQQCEHGKLLCSEMHPSLST